MNNGTNSKTTEITETLINKNKVYSRNLDRIDKGHSRKGGNSEVFQREVDFPL